MSGIHFAGTGVDLDDDGWMGGESGDESEGVDGAAKGRGEKGGGFEEGSVGEVVGGEGAAAEEGEEAEGVGGGGGGEGEGLEGGIKEGKGGGWVGEEEVASIGDAAEGGTNGDKVGKEEVGEVEMVAKEVGMDLLDVGAGGAAMEQLKHSPLYRPLLLPPAGHAADRSLCRFVSKFKAKARNGGKNLALQEIGQRRRDLGRRSELDQALQASQVVMGMAKSSDPIKPRLRQRRSTSPSMLPPIWKLVYFKYDNGERSSDRVVRRPGDSSAK